VGGEERPDPVDVGRDRALHALQDVLLRALVELQHAPGRQAAEAPLHELPQLARRLAEELAQVTVEPEARVLKPCDVEDREDVLVARAPQAAPELLQEHRRALGRAEEEERVHVGDVDALVEEVDDAEGLHLPAREVALRAIALLPRRVVGERARHEAQRREALRDDACVRLVHAERERSNVLLARDPVPQRACDGADPELLRADEPPREVGLDVSAGAPPDVREVEAVDVEDEVAEGNEHLLLDRVPHAEVPDVRARKVALVLTPIGALRGRGEPDELLRRQSVEELGVALRRGMVNLVDDDVVERPRGQVRRLRERLHRGEDVPSRLGAQAVDPELAEIGTAEHLAKDAPRLLEDLLAVSDEQERVDLVVALQVGIVERSDERLPGAGRGHDEVLRPAGRARFRELAQDRLLPILGLQVEGEEVAGALRLRERADEPPGRVLRAVEGLEAVGVDPVALEHGAHVLEHAGLVRLRDPDVPLEALRLSRMREIRGADVRGGVLRIPVEQPGLRVKAGRRVVVGDANLCPESAQELDRLHLGGSHVRRREDAQWALQREVALDERTELVETGELDERAEEVDSVGARELAREVREDALAVGVRDEDRCEERSAGVSPGRGSVPHDAWDDGAQDAFPERRFTWAQVALARELIEEVAREGDLLLRSAPRPDRDARRVANEGDELLVYREILDDLGDLDRVGSLERGEPPLERLGHELVVDPGGERGVRAAPDGHGPSVLEASRRSPKRKQTLLVPRRW
jgi:hypothetical protein